MRFGKKDYTSLSNPTNAFLHIKNKKKLRKKRDKPTCAVSTCTLRLVIGQFAFRDPGRRRAAIRAITEGGNRATARFLSECGNLYDRDDKPPSLPRKTPLPHRRFTCASLTQFRPERFRAHALRHAHFFAGELFIVSTICPFHIVSCNSLMSLHDVYSIRISL